MLRETYGHDAVHVAEIGLRGAEHAQVAATARAEGRAVVTENAADFASERDIVLAFVLKAGSSCRTETCDSGARTVHPAANAPERVSGTPAIARGR